MVLTQRATRAQALIERSGRRHRGGGIVVVMAMLASQGGLVATLLPSRAAAATAAVSTPATASPAGYEIDTATGVVFSFTPTGFTTTAGFSLNKPMVGIAGTTDGQGYWQVAGDGGIFAQPDAQFHGSQATRTLNAPVVGMAGTSDNGGYWLAAADGGVFADPDATFHGSVAGTHLVAPVVGIAALSTGGGYWLAAADGGVFALGAPFHGSAALTHPSAPVVGIAATPTGGGYWLVTATGQIFRFGNAGTYGSLTNVHINAPIVGIDATGDGHGFWLVGADGGIYAFGDAPFFHSLPGEGVAVSNIVGITGHGTGTPAPPPPTVPTLTKVTPLAGKTAGGTSVTLTGTGFAAGAAVAFGTGSGSTVVVVSSTDITVKAPAHSPGTVTVTVTTSVGTSGALAYTYDAAPTLTEITPEGGKSAGGTVVTLTGTHFVTGATVAFATKAGTTVNVVSTSKITVKAPAHTAGTVHVTVTTPGGTTGSLLYDYLPVPNLTLVTPSAGKTAGGTVITLTGSNFEGGATVAFGTGAGSTVHVVSSTRITVKAPAHGAGTVTVSVTDTGGTSNTLHYTYDPGPTLTKVTPSAGKTGGGTSVALTGTGFVTGATVAFGAGAGTTVVVVSTDEITVKAPAHAVGGVTVTVTTPGGTSNAKPYTYDAGPTLTEITPLAGKTGGGTSVTLIGTAFVTGATVAFGAGAGTTVLVVSTHEITVKAPAHAVGGVTVTVTTPGGTSDTKPYTYDAVPTLTKVTPSAGKTTGGTLVTLTGSGFSATSLVTFGTTAPTSFTVVSTHVIQADAPAQAAGTVTVTVTTPGGTSNGKTYRYEVAPELTSLTPTTGLTTGGEVVALHGHHFTETATVTIGGTRVALATFTSPTLVHIVTPAHAPGTVTVTITTPGGTSNALTFDYLTSLTQTTPKSATVSTTTSGSFSSQLKVSNATGTVTFTVTGGTTGDLLVSTTGALVTSGTLSAGLYCVTGTDHDNYGDTGTWSFCLTVSSHTLTQTTPLGATVSTTTAGSFSSHLDVSNAVGTTATFTVTGGTTGDFSVSTTGALSTTGTLPAGFYCVTGTDHDNYGDTGSWEFCLTVSSHTLTQTTPLGGTVSTTTAGSFSSHLDVSNAVGTTATFTVTGGTTGDFSVSTTGALSTTGTLPAGFYCVTGTDHDNYGDTGSWEFCLTVSSTTQTLTQTTPTSATVSTTTAGSFSSQLKVSNATGTVTFTVTGGTTGDLLVFTTGALFTTGTLSAGFYCVSGTDRDTHGDTGTWLFCLTVFSHNLTQTTPTFATVSTTTSGSFSSDLNVSNAVGTVTYTETGGTTADFGVFTTGFLYTTGTLPAGFYCVTGTDHDNYGDTGTWEFCLTVILTTHTLTQTTPTFATVSTTTAGSFSSHLNVSNATGTVTFTVTGGTTEDFSVFATGDLFTSGTLSAGFYCVSGTDRDTHGDTGTWSFCLTVLSHSLIQTTPIGGTVPTTTSGTYSSHLFVANALGTVTFTETGGTTGDLFIFSTGALFTTGTLPTGFYCVSGTDRDNHGDTGSWEFCLTVFST